MKIFNSIVALILAFLVVTLTNSYDTINEQLIELEQVKVELEQVKGELEETNADWKEYYEILLEERDALKEENKKLKTRAENTVALAYDFTEEEVYMLAQCVEAEAGIGNFQSQKYVAQVILNRLHTKKGYPDTLEGVIYHKTRGNVPQFSVAYNGAMNRVVEEETLENVREVLEYGTNLPRYVFYFYSEEVTDNWVNTLNTYKVVEGTVFAYASKEA